MDSYQKPSIQTLGTIAQFTQQDEFNLDLDGSIFQAIVSLAHGNPNIGHGTS